ncbi:MAG: hypothetical protein LBB34_03875 [Holosporales bacterium]|jgi:Fe-S cluster assembly iron-binding protein IscA|nr:hypothetical protein [Holosporales bacterium]
MISISKDAEICIKSAISRNPSKMPRIVLVAGGCAGKILHLTLDTSQENDIFVEINDVKFAISHDAQHFIGDIEVCLKDNLCSEIIIKNNGATTCRCGKSFKA